MALFSRPLLTGLISSLMFNGFILKSFVEWRYSHDFCLMSLFSSPLFHGFILKSFVSLLYSKDILCNSFILKSFYLIATLSNTNKSFGNFFFKEDLLCSFTCNNPKTFFKFQQYSKTFF